MAAIRTLRDAHSRLNVGTMSSEMVEHELKQSAVAGVGIPAQYARVTGGLSDRERAILAFERQWWRHAGAKEHAIREQFDLSAPRYYQLLNALIDRPEALAHDPMVVKRLRRVRAARQRARSARRLGFEA